MKRKILAALLGLAIAGSAVACAETDEPATSGAWSYTDDRGTAVSLDARPQRIVAQVSAAGALKDFGVTVVGTFGPLKRSDGTTEPEAGSVVPSEVTDVTGPAYGEVALERLAALKPDVVVSGKYKEFPGLWHLLEDQEKKVLQVAPTIGVEQSGKALPDTIASYMKLAEALGADVNSAKVTADKAEFSAAAERLRKIGETMRAGKRTILAIGGTAEEYFVVVPARNPDLAWYVEELGLPIRTPDKPDTAGGGYFERLSWENADSYSADVLMWDTRPASLNPEQMKKHPVFAALPEAAANRFVDWDAVAPFSYASYAAIMTKLADQLDAQLKTL